MKCENAYRVKKTFKQLLPNSTQNYIVSRRCKFGNWMNWLIFVSEMLNLLYWFINITCNQKIIKTTMMFSVVLVDIDNTQQHDSFQWIKICFIIYFAKCNIYIHIYTCILRKVKWRHNITEILLKMALNTIKQTKWNRNSPFTDTSALFSAKKNPIWINNS